VSGLSLLALLMHERAAETRCRRKQSCGLISPGGWRLSGRRTAVVPHDGAIAGASVKLVVNGDVAASGTIPRIVESFYGFDGGMDIGADLGSPVSPDPPTAPAFTRRILEVLVEPGRQ
jgi:hypothetical protein